MAMFLSQPFLLKQWRLRVIASSKRKQSGTHQPWRPLAKGSTLLCPRVVESRDQAGYLVLVVISRC